MIRQQQPMDDNKTLNGVSAMSSDVNLVNVTCSRHPDVVMNDSGNLAGCTTATQTCPKCEDEYNGVRSRLEVQKRYIDQKLQELADSVSTESFSIDSEDDDKSVEQNEYFVPGDKHVSLHDETIHTQMSWTSHYYSAQSNENHTSSDATLIDPTQNQDWTTAHKDMELKILRKKVEAQNRELLQKDLEIALLTERLNDQGNKGQHGPNEHHLMTSSNDSSSSDKEKQIHIPINCDYLTGVSQDFGEKKLQTMVKNAAFAALGKSTTTVAKTIVTKYIPLSSPTNIASSASQNIISHVPFEAKSPPFDPVGKDTTESAVSSQIQILPTTSIPYDNDTKSKGCDDDLNTNMKHVEKYSGSPKIALRHNISQDLYRETSPRNQDVSHQNMNEKLPASKPLKISKDLSSKDYIDPTTVTTLDLVMEDSPVGAFISLTASLEEDGTGSDSYDMCSSVGYTEAESILGDDMKTVESERVWDSYGEMGRYTGVVLRSTDLPHGYGRMVYEESGLRYDGQWTHGRWNGYGRAIYANEDVYDGEYQFHKRHGRGKLIWSDGRVYEGQFDCDVHHGQGIYRWPNGSAYEGDFNQGKQEGEGMMSFPDGTRYTGSFVNDYYEGFGECQWADGHAYKGEWQAGKCHGQGVETKPDGSIRHDGQWSENKPIRKSSKESSNEL